MEAAINRLVDASASLRGVVSSPMRHSALTPVFAAFRVSLHVMVVALTALPVVHAFLVDSPVQWVACVLGVAFLVLYGLGALALGSGMRPISVIWLCCLSVAWFALTVVESSAAYLVFPVFFLYLHVLDRAWGVLCVAAATVATVVVIGVGSGWSVGGVAGPIIGAAVAVLIGWGYQLIIDESTKREALIAELVATRDRLAASEREAGALEERQRLAREIHDTIAQGLSSIQMLLHAAERADNARPGIEHVRLARDVAADNLAEARRFIRQLSPAALEGRDLGGALRRLAETEWAAEGRTVTVEEVGDSPMSMDAQSALLRIAQGAMANVAQHSRASTVQILLTHRGEQVEFAIVDDGVGFDRDSVGDPVGRPDSFGLRAIRERVAQLGGAVQVESFPGRGTALRVVLVDEVGA